MPSEANKALHSAILAGDYEAVQKLFESGQASASASCDGWTPIITAANFGRTDITRDLLLPRLKVEQLGVMKRGSFPTSAAHQAALNNRVEILQLLAEKGADLDEKRPDDGCRPIDLANRAMTCRKSAAKRKSTEQSTSSPTASFEFLKSWIATKKQGPGKKNSAAKVVQQKQTASAQKKVKKAKKEVAKKVV